jgi:hypothetical protein
MKRFLAVVGVAAFLAACSDSNMTSPASQLRPGASSRDVGDPPPPPLSGSDGTGDLQVGFSDFALTAPTTDQCTTSHDFPLSFSWSFLEANGSTNEVLHVNITGGTTGSIDLHDIQNGKILAHGSVSDDSFSFTIQDTNSQSMTSEGFSAEVTGVLTDLSNGAKCQATAELSGTFVPPPPPAD